MVKLPLRDGTDWEMPPSFEMELNEAFMDVAQEMVKARLWLSANPHRRKTKAGIRRFCLNWMNKSGKLRPSLAKPVSVVRMEQPVNKDLGRERLAGIKAMLGRKVA